MQIYKKYLAQPEFNSLKDFQQNFKINVPDNFNFAYDVVDEYARIEPNKLALIWVNDQGENQNFTFKDLKEKSDATASYFQSLGIKRGDKVMLILKRRYEFWFSCLALHKIGATSIPATHLLTEKDIIYRCNAANVKSIICVGDQQVIDHVQKAQPQCSSIENIVSIGKIVPKGWGDFQKEIKKAKPFIKPKKPSENEDLLYLYFTSGTSGQPKMVVHDYTYPLAHIITAKFWHNVEENGRHLTVADTGWAKAVWGKFYGQMMAGCAIFVYEHKKFTPTDILKVISEYKITSFCAPPTVYRFLIQENIADYDLSALKYCTTAGEALNPQVFDTFKKLTGLQLKEAFGQTETAVQLATFPWIKSKPGSMGIPVPIYNIDLLKPDGTSCEDGEQGQIVIHIGDKPPLGLFKGYYKDEKQTNQTLHKGIYYTGDIAWRDEDGYYWFVGRADDVIKSSGYRIGPFEVESALMMHPAVVECAITGVPDDIRGQVVKATIVLASNQKPS